MFSVGLLVLWIKDSGLISDSVCRMKSYGERGSTLVMLLVTTLIWISSNRLIWSVSSLPALVSVAYIAGLTLIWLFSSR